MIPEINKTYFVYDDGKINKTRQDQVLIKEVIPFKEIDGGTLEDWIDEMYYFLHLYSSETDYFIKGTLLKDKEDVIFVRSIEGGWFSLGEYGGRLDIDGLFTKQIQIGV